MPCDIVHITKAQVEAIMSECKNERLIQLRRKFPAKFRKLAFECPPSDAMPMKLCAFRACDNQSGHLDERDFLPTDAARNSKKELIEPSDYSVSFFEKVHSLKKRQKKWPSLRSKIIIKGTIREEYGFVKRQGKGDMHVDLWLYEDAKPWIDFEE